MKPFGYHTVMRVTFDSNTWEKVVSPDDYPGDAKIDAIRSINSAIRGGLVEGFICETFATIETIRKGMRASYLLRRSEDMTKIVWEQTTLHPETGNVRFSGTLSVGGRSEANPALHPVVSSRFKQALSRGFLLLPSSRLGTARPPEIDKEEYRIPLTAEQKADIWAHLENINSITKAIEDRGVGFAVIQRIAAAIQQREGLSDRPWYCGLSRPANQRESRAIDRAFAEWADGDTVALYLAYGIDVLCTEDQGKSAGHSIFDHDNRQWLARTYDADLVDLDALAARLSAIRPVD